MLPALVPAVVRKIPYALFSLLFPDVCRVCSSPLTGFSRTPVCQNCLRQPAPLAAEFFCRQCRTPFQNRFPLDDEGVCALCRSGLRGFGAAYCYGAYEGALRELIHLFKYEGMKPLAGPLSEHLKCALPLDLSFDAVVPMPLHWTRRLRRGFNQSGLLAKAVAARCGIPVLHAVSRLRSTGFQAGLSRTERRRNVSGAFQAKRRVVGLKILLVDDVMTTGATASACALALKRAGAKAVTLLTLARVDRRFADGQLPLRVEKQSVGAS